MIQPPAAALSPKHGKNELFPRQPAKISGLPGVIGAAAPESERKNGG
jgi:hypothetical protein